LIARFRSAEDPQARMYAMMLIAFKSQLSSMAGDATLRAFWKERLELAEGREADAAADAYLLVATDDELRTLAAEVPRQERLAQGLLQTLSKRLPDQVPAYALRSLEKRAPPEFLRLRAVSILSGTKGPSQEKAITLGLSDPSPKVRSTTAREVPKVLPGLDGYRRLLPLLNAREKEVRDATRGAIFMGYLRRPGAHHAGCLKLLPRTGQAATWGGWAIVKAGAQEAAGRPVKAAELYRLGVKRLEAIQPEDRRWGLNLQLLMEGRLRLAALAMKKRQSKLARRQAEAVLADERGSREQVCAPLPNRYAGPECRPRHQARTVAKEILTKLP